MPYMTVEESGKFTNYKKGADGKPTGKALGSFDSKDGADKQLMALHAAEKKMAVKFYRFPQTAVNYSPISSNPAQEACSGCIFYEPSDYDWGPSCAIVQDWPAPIVPNGLCDRFELTPAPPAPTPMEVVIVDKALEPTDPADPLVKREETSELRKAFDFLLDQTKALLHLKAAGVNELEVGFKLLENNRWLGVFSNNFIDREAEIFTHKSQDEYVDRVMSGQRDMPELWFYHIPGTKHGKADWVGRVGHFLVATGDFDESPLAEAMKSYYRDAGPVGMSFGYEYPPSMKINGVYHYFDAIEVTTLPPEAAANPYTYFEGSKMMDVTQAQRDAFMKAVKDPVLGANVLNGLTQFGNQLDAMGTASKMNSTPPTSTPPAAPTASPGEDVEARKALNVIFGGQKAMTDALQTMTVTLGAMSADTKAFQEDVTKKLADLKGLLDQHEAILSGASRASKAASTVVPPASMQGVVPAGAAPQKFITEQGQFDSSIFADMFGFGQPDPATPPVPMPTSGDAFAPPTAGVPTPTPTPAAPVAPAAPTPAPVTVPFPNVPA